MLDMIPDALKGGLIGFVVGFVALCIREAVLEYRLTRDMIALEAAHRMRMKHYAWLYGRVTPLFHEQRRLFRQEGED